MPRPAKLWWHSQKKQWACEHKGKIVVFGNDRTKAETAFYRLKGSLPPAEPVGPDPTVGWLVEQFLRWCRVNKAAATHRWYADALNTFVPFVGEELIVSGLKAHHIHAWVGAHPEWSDSTKHDYMSAVQRVMRWAYDQELMDREPIRRLEKPSPTRREVVVSRDDWKRILRTTDKHFRPLLAFCRCTGCRPFEARTIEARHIVADGRVAVYEVRTSKGKKKNRVVFLTKRIRPLTAKLCRERPDGSLFRNSRGNAWTKDAVRQRMDRLQEKLGIESLFAYALRHTFVTEALTKLPLHMVAQLAGHNARTALGTYAHLDGKIEEMLDAADRALG